MTIPGLHIQAARKRQSADWCRTKAASAHADPRIASENETSALASISGAEKHEAHARENDALILSIETLICGMHASDHKSAERTLAIRHLEDASMRLRRENGDLP